jgi:putative transcriptional regulator
LPTIRDLRLGHYRRALRLTQEEFATRYHIPLSSLRNWEEGPCEPDQLAHAYLTVIDSDPEGVARALAHPPKAAKREVP